MRQSSEKHELCCITLLIKSFVVHCFEQLVIVKLQVSLTAFKNMIRILVKRINFCEKILVNLHKENVLMHTHSDRFTRQWKQM